MNTRFSSLAGLVLILSTAAAFAAEEVSRVPAVGLVGPSAAHAGQPDAPSLQAPAGVETLARGTEPGASAPAADAPAALGAAVAAPAAQAEALPAPSARTADAVSPSPEDERARNSEFGATERALDRVRRETRDWDMNPEAIGEARTAWTARLHRELDEEARRGESAPPPPVPPAPHRAAGLSATVASAVAAFAAAASASPLAAVVVLAVVGLYPLLRYAGRGAGRGAFDHAGAALLLRTTAWVLALPTLFNFTFGLIVVGMPHSGLSADPLLSLLIAPIAAFLWAYGHGAAATRQAGRNPAVAASIGAFSLAAIVALSTAPLVGLIATVALGVAVALLRRPADEKASIARALAWGFGTGFGVQPAIMAVSFFILGEPVFAAMTAAVAAAFVAVAFIPSYLYQRQAKNIVR